MDDYGRVLKADVRNDHFPYSELETSKNKNAYRRRYPFRMYQLLCYYFHHVFIASTTAYFGYTCMLLGNT